MIRKPPMPVPVKPAVPATAARRPPVRTKAKGRKPPTPAAPGLAQRLLAAQPPRPAMAPGPVRPPMAPPFGGGNGGF